MEFFLLLWDELDDLSGACRHLVTSTADEVVSLGIPVAAAAVADQLPRSGATTLTEDEAARASTARRSQR